MPMVNLTYDQIQQIVVDTLKEDYKTLLMNIRDAECTQNLTDVTIADLKNNKKFLKGIKRCLTYYLPETEAKSFIQEMGEIYG
jgi:hypothetical protein